MAIHECYRSWTNLYFPAISTGKGTTQGQDYSDSRCQLACPCLPPQGAPCVPLTAPSSSSASELASSCPHAFPYSGGTRSLCDFDCGTETSSRFGRGWQCGVQSEWITSLAQCGAIVPEAVNILDIDPRIRVVEGYVRITEPSNLAGLVGYNVYWGAGATQVSSLNGFVGYVESSGIPKGVVDVPLVTGTKLPDDASHVLAFAVDNSGSEASQPSSVLINDFGGSAALSRFATIFDIATSFALDNSTGSVIGAVCLNESRAVSLCANETSCNVSPTILSTCPAEASGMARACLLTQNCVSFAVDNGQGLLFSTFQNFFTTAENELKWVETARHGGNILTGAEYGDNFVMHLYNSHLELNQNILNVLATHLTANMTVHAWVRAQGVAQRTCIVAEGSGPLAGNGGWCCGLEVSTEIEASVYPFFSIRTNASQNYITASTSAVVTMENGTFSDWMHITCLYNSSNISVFVNGSLQASVTTDSSGIFHPTTSATARACISCRSDLEASGSFLQIDNVAVHNDSLNATQISLLGSTTFAFSNSYALQNLQSSLQLLHSFPSAPTSLFDHSTTDFVSHAGDAEAVSFPSSSGSGILLGWARIIDMGSWAVARAGALQLSLSSMTANLEFNPDQGTWNGTIEIIRATPAEEENGIQSYQVWFATNFGDKIDLLLEVPVWALPTGQSISRHNIPLATIPYGASHLMLISTNSELSTPVGPLLELGLLEQQDGYASNILEDSHLGGSDSFIVTAGSKTQSNMWHRFGSSNAVFLDGIESPQLTLYRYHTYAFWIVIDNPECSICFTKSSMECGTEAEVSGATDEFSSIPRKIIFTPSGSTPSQLFYQSTCGTFSGAPLFIEQPLLTQGYLQNGWISSVHNAPAYFQREGLVWLQGSVRDGSHGKTVFQLPIGYRPAFTHRFATTTALEDAGNATAVVVVINPQGHVIVESSGSNSASFDSIHFQNVRFPDNLVADFTGHSGGVTVTFENSTQSVYNRWAQLASTDLTVAFWIRLEGSTQLPHASIVSMKQRGDITGWSVHLDASGTFFVFTLATVNATTPTSLDASSVEIESGTWYHVACTYNGVLMKVWIDGVLIKSSLSQHGAILYSSASNASVYLLSTPESPSIYGLLDNITIFGDVVSDDVIASWASNSGPSPHVLEDLIAAFEFQDFDSKHVFDSSSGLFHGVVANGTRGAAAYNPNLSLFETLSSVANASRAPPQPLPSQFARQNSNTHFFRGGVRVEGSCTLGCSGFATLLSSPHPPSYPYIADFDPPSLNFPQISSSGKIFHLVVNETSRDVSIATSAVLDSRDAVTFDHVLLLPTTGATLSGGASLTILDTIDASGTIWAVTQAQGSVTCFSGTIESPTHNTTWNGIEMTWIASLPSSMILPVHPLRFLVACQISGTRSACAMTLTQSGQLMIDNWNVTRDSGSWVSIDGACYAGGDFGVVMGITGSSTVQLNGDASIILAHS